eukprot:scaffold38620_cov36-Phaeocystis_antarctica.AAC.2
MGAVRSVRRCLLSVVPPNPLARGREVVVPRQRGATRPLRRVEQRRILRRLGSGVDTRLPAERRLALALHVEVDLVIRHSTAERGNVSCPEPRLTLHEVLDTQHNAGKQRVNAPCGRGPTSRRRASRPRTLHTQPPNEVH